MLYIAPYIQEVNEDEHHALGVSCMRIIYGLKIMYPYFIFGLYVYTVIFINGMITDFFQ